MATRMGAPGVRIELHDRSGYSLVETPNAVAGVVGFAPRGELNKIQTLTNTAQQDTYFGLGFNNSKYNQGMYAARAVLNAGGHVEFVRPYGEEIDKTKKLQSLVEATSSNLRFILTCNEIYRIPDAIKSRCTPIAFDHPGDDADYKRRIFKRLKHIAKTETELVGGTFAKETLVEVIQQCYPDIRAMINAMHLTFLENGGSIVGHPNVIREETIANIYRLTISMDPRRLRYYISANVQDFRGVYVPFGLYFLNRIPLPENGQVDFLYIAFSSMLGKAYRASLSQVNQEVSLMEFLSDVQMLLAQYQMIGKMPLDAVQQPDYKSMPENQAGQAG